MSQHIASFENVTKIYNKIIVALSECTAEIPPGITGFLGPNGAGKTTMIKLLAGEIYPNIGRVNVLGENPWNNPAIHKRIGYISDVNAHFDFTTPLHFSVHLARLAGCSREDAVRRAYSVQRMLGMGEFLDRKLIFLSKGMKQRVKIANAFLMNPELIIADEPLSGLDPFGRSLVFQIFEDYANNGGSIFLSSHILFEIEHLTRELILIYNGEIVAQGQTKLIREKLSTIPYKFEISTDNAKLLGKYLLETSSHIKAIEFKTDVITTSKNTHSKLLITTSSPYEFFNDLIEVSHQNNLLVYNLVNLEDEAETEFIFNSIINS